ncbi:MAG: dTMP kinase [Syntrophomonadaceae bacterium]|nr:dTMP kinase [Syntrophomonadaceae bacterium]MDD3023206.1 dTMP kinase [Syntrophomonadaceae bacterium]
MKGTGIFISLEGIDGCGKSSLKESLHAYLSKYEVVSTREPGGTTISEKIRAMLLDIDNESMLPRTEAILYAAARSQLVEEVIKPALSAGKIVLADRYIDSTLAYQGYGRGLDLDYLLNLNHLCTGGVKPHLTLLLDISPEEGLRRRKKVIPDRLEKEGIYFQEKVKEGYLNIAREEPGRIKVLDGGQDHEIVLAAAIKYIDEILQHK